MKIITVSIFIIFSVATYGQNDTVMIDTNKIQAVEFFKNLKTESLKYLDQNKYTLTGFFIAGALDGTVEILRHDYDNFKKVFPGANDQYWNPPLSSKNKYLNGIPANGPKFPGSTTYLVWTTDGYHLLRTLERTTVCISITIKIAGKKRKWYSYVIDAAAHQLAYSAGDYLTYEIIFKHSKF